MFGFLMLVLEWIPTPRVQLEKWSSCLFAVIIVLNIMQCIRICCSCFGLSVIMLGMANFDCKGTGGKNMVVWAICGIIYYVGLWEGCLSKGLGCLGCFSMIVM